MSAEKDVTVKRIPFDGKKEGWRIWRKTALAFAAAKTFRSALTMDLSPFITDEQFEAGATPAVTATSKKAKEAAAAAAALAGEEVVEEQVVTANDIARYKRNAEAYAFLSMSCAGAAWVIIEDCTTKGCTTGNAHEAWTKLCARYEATDVGSDFTRTSKSFYDCKLNGLVDDPEMWIYDLEHHNLELGKIDKGQYLKDELEMKAHILGNLPTGYEPIKTKFNGQLEKISIADLRKDVADFWERNKKEATAHDKNIALVGFRKFKGTCYNCGAIGHKGVDCKKPKKQQFNGPKKEVVAAAAAVDKKSKDKSSIQCFKCKEFGHYANKCPVKEKNDSGMFCAYANMDDLSLAISVDDGRADFEAFCEYQSTHWFDDRSYEGDSESSGPTGHPGEAYVAAGDVAAYASSIDNYGAAGFWDNFSDDDAPQDKCTEQLKMYYEEGYSGPVARYEYDLETGTFTPMEPLTGDHAADMMVVTDVYDAREERKERKAIAQKKNSGKSPAPELKLAPVAECLLDLKKDDSYLSDETIALYEKLHRKYKWHQGETPKPMPRTVFEDVEIIEVIEPDEVTTGYSGIGIKEETMSAGSGTSDESAGSKEDEDLSCDEVLSDEPDWILVTDPVTGITTYVEATIDNWADRIAPGDEPPDVVMLAAMTESGSQERCFSTSDGKVHWLMDSGATCHVTNNKNFLVKAVHVKRKVTIGDGKEVKATMVGNVHLTDEKGNEIKLTNVYYIEGFVKNLLSVRRFMDSGSVVIRIDNLVFKIESPTGEILTAERKPDNLYYLTARLSESNNETVLTSLAPRKITMGEAHRLFGHADIRSVKKTVEGFGWQLSETTMLPCGACALAKARAKAVPKTTLTRATQPGERLFVDFSGPYSPSLNGSTMWLMVVDDFSRKTWCFYTKSKALIAGKLRPLLQELKGIGKVVKYVRCDNAGENTKHLKDLCVQEGIIMEFTAPHTPQQNGVAERAFVTIRNRAHAMMIDARLDSKHQAMLWAEATSHASHIGNTMIPASRLVSSNDLFFGKALPPPTTIVEWGRVCHVTKREKIQKKFDEKAAKMLYLGQADERSSDTMRLFNPETKNVVMSQDVVLSEWHGRLTAMDNLDLFEQARELMPEPVQGSGDAQEPATTAAKHPLVTDVSDDDDDDDDIGRGGSKAATTMNPSRDNSTESITEAIDDLPDLVDNDGNDATTDGGDDAMEVVHNVSLHSEPGSDVPKDFRFIAKVGNEKGWLKAVDVELGNLQKRNVTTPKMKLPAGRKALSTRWVFKWKKDPFDDSKRFEKARLVVKGYEQIPGVDFTESFSPVACDAAIRTVLAMSLYYGTHSEGWTIDVIDVETAFLNADLEEEVYIKIPDGYQQFTGKLYQHDDVLKLNKALYGLVQSPRAWIKHFTAALLQCDLKQCLSEPCVLYQRDGEVVKLLVVIYCDDCIIAGHKNDVARLKQQIALKFAISDLGKLKKHLGVTYKFGEDDNGPFLLASMNEFVDEIIRDCETCCGELREFPTPGYSGASMAKSEEEPIMHEQYRSIVGKVLYLVKKVLPTCANSVRELSGFLDCPGTDHWKSVSRLSGYLKSEYEGLKMRPPTELRIIGCVDSDWASDKNDRKSIGGYILTIGFCIVDWMSKKQSSVALSSTEAEYMAYSDAASSIKFLRMLMGEITGKRQRESLLYEDNTGAIFLLKNDQVGKRTKHIDIRYRHVNNMIKDGDLKAEFIRSESNPADIMTKNVVEKLFTTHAHKVYDGTILRDDLNKEDVETTIESETCHEDMAIDRSGCSARREYLGTFNVEGPESGSSGKFKEVKGSTSTCLQEAGD
jgi:Reverse transcriptase (RNA-dependent DNA polymerase)/Zinc knuckle